MFLYIYNNLFVKQSPYLLIHQIYIRKTRNDARGYRVSIVQFLTQSLEYCIKSSSSYLLLGRSQRMRFFIAQTRTRVATTRPVIAKTSYIVDHTS